MATRKTKSPREDEKEGARSSAAADIDDDATDDAEQTSGSEDPLSRLWSSLGQPSNARDVRRLRQEAAADSLQGVIDKHPVAARYNLLILHDENQLIRSDADKIYNAIRKFKEARPILLILYSSGGEVEPAYLISKLCRESAQGRFAVAVPRRAKSAATLICCGADELHMGAMSELGPIDPQIGNYPALGLGGAIEHIAEIVSRMPAAAEMFASYLAATVPPINLGYYERVVESAAQYAERLLEQHRDDLVSEPHEIARTLVYSYMDHGFVIDRNEAGRIFGDAFVRVDTDEYKLANAVYTHMSLLSWIAQARDYQFYWVGSPRTGCNFLERPQA